MKSLLLLQHGVLLFLSIVLANGWIGKIFYEDMCESELPDQKPCYIISIRNIINKKFGKENEMQEFPVAVLMYVNKDRWRNEYTDFWNQERF